jgi:hypothetical protein
MARGSVRSPRSSYSGLPGLRNSRSASKIPRGAIGRESSSRSASKPRRSWLRRAAGRFSGDADGNRPGESRRSVTSSSLLIRRRRLSAVNSAERHRTSCDCNTPRCCSRIRRSAAVRKRRNSRSATYARSAAAVEKQTAATPPTTQATSATRFAASAKASATATAPRSANGAAETIGLGAGAGVGVLTVAIEVTVAPVTSRQAQASRQPPQERLKATARLTLPRARAAPAREQTFPGSPPGEARRPPQA